jgi:hypothetical protein
MWKKVGNSDGIALSYTLIGEQSGTMMRKKKLWIVEVTLLLSIGSWIEKEWV